MSVSASTAKRKFNPASFKFPRQPSSIHSYTSKKSTRSQNLLLMPADRHIYEKLPVSYQKYTISSEPDSSNTFTSSSHQQFHQKSIQSIQIVGTAFLSTTYQLKTNIQQKINATSIRPASTLFRTQETSIFGAW